MRVTVIRNPSLSAAQRRVAGAAGIAALLRRCGHTLGVESRAQLTVRLSDDADLRQLNRRFRGVDEPTDVLAFPAAEEDGAAADGRVGDIAISVERALEQSPSGAEELRLLAVHGLLHCLGHDHADRAGAATMTAATRQLLPDQAVSEL